MAAPGEQFSQGDSLLHRMDPRAKVIGALALTLCLATTTSLLVGGIGLGLGAALVLTARLPWGHLWRRLLMVNAFTLFLWIMLPLTYGSESVSVGPLSISLSGVALAGQITLKTNGIICVIISLLSTSSVPAIGRAMLWWKVPKKLCLILIFSYRYLFVIHDEYVRLRRAAMMRCFAPSTTLATYKTYGNLVGMTLVRSYVRSQRVGQAMQLRCFQGQFHALSAPKAHSSDFIMGSALVLIAIILCFIGG